MEVVGQILGGGFGQILVRQKAGKDVELGELLVTESEGSKTIYQAYDLFYGSQIPQESRELFSGMKLEGHADDLEFAEGDLRNYVLVRLKSVATIKDGKPVIPKGLPKFFSKVREITKEDLSFITVPKNPLYLGKVRSGSKELDISVSLDGEKVFSHHILIPATTGRGKSNLTKVMAWEVMDKDYCGLLILDPHDEYYGRNEPCLKDHPKAREKLVYYTARNPPAGSRSLVINVKSIKPWHFEGVSNMSEPQKNALYSFHNFYGDEWVEAIIAGKQPNADFDERTLAVVKRKMMLLLGAECSGEEGGPKEVSFSGGVFSKEAGKTTLSDVCSELEKGKTVIIDTSMFSGELELLIGSMIVYGVFNSYKSHKMSGSLNSKPVISVIIEEAPRVLGSDVLKNGPNIFSTIAREGRKFKVGICAITQLPSLIPKEILANMNTKIIMGLEMGPERQAIIESAAQDLSTDDRNIASLDKGEALITSHLTTFAVPISIPDFSKYVREKISGEKSGASGRKEKARTDVSGLAE